jgi:ligand-binding SRPBCC domain-containing protein
MKYRHTFRVPVSQGGVAQFHRRAESLSAITPPPLVVQVHRAPETMSNGDEMEFTMWVGPLPVRWLARVEDASPSGFVDRQLKGPFQSWVHQHRFVAVDEQTTDVVDEIEAHLRAHLWWALIGLGMWLGLPLLFAYRGWKTRKMLLPAS